MGNGIYIAIGIALLISPLTIGIYRLVKTVTSDKITFIKGDKRITVSASSLSAEDRKNLINL